MGGHKISARANGYILGNDLLIGFAFFVVLARFYCRIWMGTKRGLWWDDLFLLLAYVRILRQCSETCASIAYQALSISSSL